MAQKFQGATSGTSSSITESDQYDIANEVEWACMRLQDAIKDEKAARESLESLFNKRREDALGGVQKAQRHLELVNQEEERLRRTVTRNHFSTDKAHGKEEERAVNQAVLNVFQGLNAQYKAKSGVKAALSPLERYISEEGARLNTDKRIRDRYKEDEKALLQLIAKFDKPSDIIVESPRSDSGSGGSDFKGRVGVNLVDSAEHNEEDIALLKERLKETEEKIEWQSKEMQKTETRIDSYRRLLAASLP